jgi:hypothetical protein
MTIAEFFKKDGEVIGFKVKGHSGYEDRGKDVVCASVSSAVMITANVITEVLGYKADVSAYEDTITLKTNIKGDEKLQKLYEMLIAQLQHIALEFENNLKVQFTEV